MLHAVRGYLVHLYTASTLVFSVLSILWVMEGRLVSALLAMAVAVFIDATDGALARRYDVARTASRVDGGLLDNLVDFISYVFAPLIFLLYAGYLLQPTWVFASMIVIGAAYAFSRSDAKQADQGFFVGFPSYWNVVAVYAFLLDLTPAATTTLVVGCALLSFSNLRFLYVTRMRRGRALHLALGGLWALAILGALTTDDAALQGALTGFSLLYVVFYTLASIRADRRERRGERELDPASDTRS